MEKYSQHFGTYKQDKKLKFLPQLGTVDLSIELKDRTVEVTVPPLEAAIIDLFTNTGEILATLNCRNVAPANPC